jgi:hypothetical protein
MIKTSDDIGVSALKQTSIVITNRSYLVEVTIELAYLEDMAQMLYVQKRLPHIVEPILQKYRTTHMRLLKLHDWVVTHFRYDKSLTHYSAYAGLAKGKTVCNGYAMMFAYLCRAAQIPCQIAVGEVDDRGPHAWNLVRLDHAWYHIDTTWDSPVSDSPTSFIPYGYYMLTDREMALTRKVGFNAGETRTPTARTTYAETLQLLSQRKGEHVKEIEQIRFTTGLIYTEPRYTVTAKAQIFQRINECMRKGLYQETVRYLQHPNLVTGDLEWVQEQFARASMPRYRRLRITYQPYYRAGEVHTLLMLDFR